MFKCVAICAGLTLLFAISIFLGIVKPQPDFPSLMTIFIIIINLALFAFSLSNLNEC